MSKTPTATSRVVGALIAVGFLAILGLQTVKYLRDRQEVRMYEQLQADYFEHGLADDVMQMHREQQLADLQPTLDLIAGLRGSDDIHSTKTEPMGAETGGGKKAEMASPVNPYSEDKGPTPVEPDPSAPHKEH
ncbi:MAG: hypothetical protein AAGK04_00980 [Planctomycetota bacterium]